MKTMKNLGVSRMLGSVRRRASPSPSTPVPVGGPEALPLDTPEANAQRSVKLFCESGGPQSQQGEEVLYLPTIVEAAESSPAAAKECAVQIRRFLSKDFGKPHMQYNAIMLTRILSDNPGKSFTRNIDAKFVDAIKNLLRTGTDLSVKQILIETLENFEREKKHDENLSMLMQMWRKEQEKMAKVYGPKGTTAQRSSQAGRSNDSNYFSRSHQNKGLPTPAELSSRIEEARTSAKLLTQLVQSTPPQELLSNDLIREFANRCLSASRSIQGYMAAENPGPDNDTMLTLIETNEQLALAQTKHQRAILTARKTAGFGAGDGTSPVGSGNNSHSPAHTDGAFTAPPGPPPSHTKAAAQVAAMSRTSAVPPAPSVEDPFKDPERSNQGPAMTQNQPYPKDERPANTEKQFHERLGVEPYHPGFNSTQSYMGRQESSLGKVTMHAAVPETTREVKDEDDEELYEAENRKPPVFRY